MNAPTRATADGRAYLDRLPAEFSDVVNAVIAFADRAINGATEHQSWDPATGVWS